MAKQCLVVDDVEVSRYATTLIFEDLGFEVKEAFDTASCLSELKNIRPDVILVDWHLRKESGLDLIGKIRQMSGFQMVPVLVISGIEKEESLAEMTKAGAAGFIAKPATVDSIKTALKRLQIL
jgi:CheY-like chemotaxis protein